MYRCTPEQPYCLMPPAANNQRRHKNTGIVKLPVSVDPLLQQLKAILQSKNNFRWSVSKASEVDDTEKENGITQYDTHKYCPLQTASLHQQLEQVSEHTRQSTPCTLSGPKK